MSDEMHKTLKHPTQPIYLDEVGIARFKPNAIVRFLIDLCTQRGIADMNALAIMPFTREDREQFAQLIGYSVSGAGELSYFFADTIDAADAEVARLCTELRQKAEKKA